MRFSVVLSLVLLSFASCAEYQKGNHVPVDYFYQPGDHLARVSAVKDKPLEWFQKLFDTLTDNQKDLNAIIDPATGDTFLHLAIKVGSPNMAQALIKSGADVFLVNKAGKTSINLIQESGASKPMRRLFAVYTGAEEDSSDDEVQIVDHINRYRRVQEGNGGVGQAAFPITTPPPAVANNSLANRRIRTVGPAPTQWPSIPQQPCLPMNNGAPRLISVQNLQQTTLQPTAQASYHPVQQTQPRPVQPMNPSLQSFQFNQQPLSNNLQSVQQTRTLNNPLNSSASTHPAWTITNPTAVPTNQPSQRPQNSLIYGRSVLDYPVARGFFYPHSSLSEIFVRQNPTPSQQSIRQVVQQSQEYLPPRAQPSVNQIAQYQSQVQSFNQQMQAPPRPQVQAASINHAQAAPRPQVQVASINQTQAPPRPQVQNQQTGPAIMNPENLDSSALNLLRDPTLYSPKQKTLPEIDPLDPVLLFDLLNDDESNTNTKTDASAQIKPAIPIVSVNSVTTATNAPSFRFNFPKKLASAPQNNDKRIEKFSTL